MVSFVWCPPLYSLGGWTELGTTRECPGCMETRLYGREAMHLSPPIRMRYECEQKTPHLDTTLGHHTLKKLQEDTTKCGVICVVSSFEGIA